MSIIKYTKKYLTYSLLALLVICGVGALVYSQIQKEHSRDHHGTFDVAEDAEPSDTARQNLWQKITPKLKKKPKTRHSHGHHHDFGHPPPPVEYPRDLKERLDKVTSDGNSYYTNPNFFQEVFEAVSDGRDLETTIEILKEYGIYTDVVLEHMDSYEAFMYVLERAPTGYKGPAVKYGERVISEDPGSAEALEAGILLGGEDNLRRVLKHHPVSALAAYKLGSLLLDDKRPGEAIVYLKKSTQGTGDRMLGPAYQMRLGAGDRMLGLAYQRLGDYKSAWVHLKKAYSLNPHHPSRWVQQHLELIAAGDPYILPFKSEAASAAIDQVPVVVQRPFSDIPADPPEVFVDAFVVPSDIPASPQSLGGPSPEEFARQDAEHQAFLELLREQEAFARRLAAEEQFKSEYFKEVEAFIQWAESIENDAPIDTNNFLAKEMERHLLGKQTTFAPDRIKRGFNFIQKYGQEDGIKRLQQLDPDLAKEVTQRLDPKRVPRTHPRE